MAYRSPRATWPPAGGTNGPPCLTTCPGVLSNRNTGCMLNVRARFHAWGIAMVCRSRIEFGVAIVLLVPTALAQSARSPTTGRTGVVALQVIDDETDAPLPGVRVSILGDSAERLTDERGRAVLAVKRDGRLPVVLRRLGYMPGSVMADVSSTDTTRLTFAMSRVAQTLATVAVNEKALANSPMLAAFERRRLLGSGSSRYVTREDIEQLRPLRLSDVIRTIPSVTLMMDGTKPIPMNRRGISLGGLGCGYQIGVDGHLMEGGFDMNSVEPAEVYGVEVFPGPATVPMEYRSSRRSSGCGLIMIWTRRSG
jgi:hypothetical protein